jgi:hypothetical protein
MEITQELTFKKKLILMAELINNRIDELNAEKLVTPDPLLKVVEMERQKYLAKAETMLEVINLLGK